MVHLPKYRITFIFYVAGIAFIALAVIGAFLSHCPVPYMDMWNGYLEFYDKVNSGDWMAWWIQHNDHRIVLSRLFFWMDLAWFKGTGWFLLVINYLLAGLIYYFCHLFLAERIPEEKDRFTRQILSLIILMLCFSWIQEDNFTSGFQSQFFFSQLLPLSSYFYLHKAYNHPKGSGWPFLIACILGVMSVGSMVNGILVLPLMTLLASILKMKRQQIVILFLLSVITITLYFNDYHFREHHGSSFFETIISDPIGVIQYILIYIGGPIYYMTLKNLTIPQLAGLFLVTSAIFFLKRHLVQSSKASLPLALLTYLLYLSATAFCTAGGRLLFGLDQALSSRYQTPALMAWIALLILYAPTISEGLRRFPARVITALIFVPILLFPHQLKAAHSKQDKLFDRYIAALSLELGIKDQAQILSIFPSAEWALSIAKRPVEKNWSIFGDPLIKDANELIGQSISSKSTMQCKGGLNEIAIIPDQHRYVKVRGWIFQNKKKRSPKILYFYNKECKIIGYGLTGQPREDLKKTISSNAFQSGFKGYLLAREKRKGFRIRGYFPDCELTVVPDL